MSSPRTPASRTCAPSTTPGSPPSTSRATRAGTWCAATTAPTSSTAAHPGPAESCRRCLSVRNPVGPSRFAALRSSLRKGKHMGIRIGRALAAIVIAGLMLGASNAAPLEGRGAAGEPTDAVSAHAFAALAGTVGGILAAQEARAAYRRQANPHYLAPYPAPYYPYALGYPYW